MENPKYKLKGATGVGYALKKIENSIIKFESVSREDLIANDTHAVAFTFNKILMELRDIV